MEEKSPELTKYLDEIRKDVSTVRERMATKDELAKLVTLEEFDQFRTEVKEEFANLREAIQALTISVDKLTKAFEIYHQEQIALAAKVDRHEKWIQRIAEKLRIKLEY